jgi:hypothetical protein
MVLCVVSDLWANVLNLMVFVIKAFVIDLEFNLYIKLLSVKVYIVVFIRELIRVVYLSLLFYVYSFCI